jgi:hypothetical protein
MMKLVYQDNLLNQEQLQLTGDVIRYIERYFGPLAEPVYPKLARIYDIGVELASDKSASCGCQELEPIRQLTRRLCEQNRHEQRVPAKRSKGRLKETQS